MTATNVRQSSQIASITLKVAGGVMILSSLLDFIVLTFPVQINNPGWLIGLATQLVDRGIIPMVGIALLLAGFWIGSASVGPQDNPKKILDLRLWALLLSSLLGLIYLLLFPVHLNNVYRAQNQTLEQINEQATEAEQELQNRIQSPEFQNRLEERKAELKAQITSLLQDEERLQEAIDNNEVPASVQQLLEESRTDPAAIDRFLDQQAQALPEQLLGRIRSRREQLQDNTSTRTLKSSLQTGINSLLLAIGYVTIGGTGLKSLGIGGSKGRRRPTAPR
ncbi:MAG: HpsJ family protein [Cyanobacteriota bacterium]|nr:HpsJ family protein [Cyanobacteriota bacterium]